MSSIGSALVTRAHDPPFTTYNWPDSQDHERPGRQSPEPERAPRIVKIIATPFHRNLGIDSSSLPSGDFEEQIRRGFRDNADDCSYIPSGGLFFTCKTSTGRNPTDGGVATTTSAEVNGLRFTSVARTLGMRQSYADVGTLVKYTTDVRTFEDLGRMQRNVADNHRPKPTKVIEARRQLDLQRAASPNSKVNNMEKAFAKAKRREKQPPHRTFVIKSAYTRSLPPLDEPPFLSPSTKIYSIPGCDPVAPPTLSKLIGSNILGQAQKLGSPLSVAHVPSEQNSSETMRVSQDSYDLDGLGAALPPELPAGTWNFRPIAASLPYLRPEMRARISKKPELDSKPYEGTDTSTRKKVRFARESSGRELEVHESSRLEKRSYTEKNRAASRASSQKSSSSQC